MRMMLALSDWTHLAQPHYSSHPLETVRGHYYEYSTYHGWIKSENFIASQCAPFSDLLTMTCSQQMIIIRTERQ